MVRSIPFENSGVTSPSLLYLISIIIYSCNIIIVIAAIPRDHRRLLPRQFEERDRWDNRNWSGTKKKTMEPIICLKWDGESETIRNLLLCIFGLNCGVSWPTIVTRDRERTEAKMEMKERKKKKSEIIYIYYCIESCALRLRFKLVRL